jgi:hypothetical protein
MTYYSWFNSLRLLENRRTKKGCVRTSTTFETLVILYRIQCRYMLYTKQAWIWKAYKVGMKKIYVAVKRPIKISIVEFHILLSMTYNMSLAVPSISVIIQTHFSRHCAAELLTIVFNCVIFVYNVTCVFISISSYFSIQSGGTRGRIEGNLVAVGSSPTELYYQ